MELILRLNSAMEGVVKRGIQRGKLACRRPPLDGAHWSAFRNLHELGQSHGRAPFMATFSKTERCEIKKSTRVLIPGRTHKSYPYGAPERDIQCRRANQILR